MQPFRLFVLGAAALILLPRAARAQDCPVDASFTVSDTVLCPGECLIVSFQGDTPGATYEFDRAGATPDPNQLGRLCFPTEPGTYVLRRTGTLDTCTVTFEVAVRLRVVEPGDQPNIFTPNNDDVNDYFRPRFGCTPASFRMTVYNRWGQVVHTAREYEPGWNGVADDGAGEAPADVYFWIAEYSTFEAPQTVLKLRGDVTLLR